MYMRGSRIPLLALTLVWGCDVEGKDTGDGTFLDACVDDGGACEVGGSDGGEPDGAGATGGTPVVESPAFEVFWEGGMATRANDEDMVTLAIDDGDDAHHTYKFGFAQTGVDNGWYGEDCLPGDMNGNGLDVCHDAGEDGVVLESVSHIPAVDETHTLLFKSSHDAGQITYVVLQTDTDTCWTFGNEPSYYTESLLHCLEYTSPP